MFTQTCKFKIQFIQNPYGVLSRTILAHLTHHVYLNVQHNQDVERIYKIHVLVSLELVVFSLGKDEQNIG